MMRIIYLLLMLCLFTSAGQNENRITKYTVDDHHDILSILNLKFELKRRVALQNPWILKGIVYHNWDIKDFRSLDTGTVIKVPLPESYPRYNSRKKVSLKDFDSFVIQRMKITESDLNTQKKKVINPVVNKLPLPKAITHTPIIQVPELSNKPLIKETTQELFKAPELKLQEKVIFYCVSKMTDFESLLKNEFRISRDKFYNSYLARMKGINDHVIDFNNIEEKTLIKIMMPKGQTYQSRISTNKFFMTKVTHEETTLTKFVKEKLGDQIYYIENDDDYMKDIKELNPEIKFWSVIGPGVKVKMYIPVAVSNSCSNPEKEVKKKFTKFKKELKKKKEIESKFKWTGFAMSSIGNFSEKVQGAVVTSTQSSPITLGLAMSYKKSKDSRLSTSLYLSKLSAQSNSDADVFVPSEFGITAYYERPRVDKFIGFYIGYDYESFSTFNTEELINFVDIAVREQGIHYTTLGLAKAFKIASRPFYGRLSLSYSLVSSASKGDSFKGVKGMFFLTSPINDKWAVNFLYKLHQLAGPTSLVISRYGLGLSIGF